MSWFLAQLLQPIDFEIRWILVADRHIVQIQRLRNLDPQEGVAQQESSSIKIRRKRHSPGKLHQIMSRPIPIEPANLARPAD